MAFRLKHRQLVPCICSILILLLVMSFSYVKAELCECTDSDQDRRSNRTIHNARSDFSGSDFSLIDRETGHLQTVGLNFLRNMSDSEKKNNRVLSTIDRAIRLRQDRPGGLGVDEAWFSVNIIYRPMSSDLTFLVLPGEALESLEKHGANDTSWMQDDGSLKLQGTSRNAIVSGSSVSGAILLDSSSVVGMDGPVMAVNINIDEGEVCYAVWIDYDRVGRRLLVYVDVVGNPKPDNTIAEMNLNISGVTYPFVNFGLLSTVAQQLNLSLWNVMVEDLPSYPDKGSLSGMVTILSSVLGSVAATTVMATAVMCYFNSRYRRWHKDLDQLARSMERLPGVPMKVKFADIKKATSNFHETMKLGGGGFGTVYRCTLPATASKTDRPMDVAVKRFTRDVQNRRYDDFLAEVSIINRLRHKNIVPLVGWSYNKGEPLLVFEFMTNGSLDQHLFPKGGSGTKKQQERPTRAAIRQWATRYEIIRDIATGLHYVHHEYEPMVLHRDIKASNMMLDSSFGARLGDFGLACTVEVDQTSITGLGGTWGYIAPEYAMSGKATRQTDIYALGVLILEVVTGEQALLNRAVDGDDVHITDWVWRLHQQEMLPECLDTEVLASSSEDNEERQLGVSSDAERLLLLGLACSNPNPSERPTMPEVVQVIAKSVPPPMVPLMKPRFVWPPEGVASSSDNSAGTSMTSVSDLYMSTTSTREPQSLVSLGQLAMVYERRAAAGHASLELE